MKIEICRTDAEAVVDKLEGWQQLDAHQEELVLEFAAYLREKFGMVTAEREREG